MNAQRLLLQGFIVLSILALDVGLIRDGTGGVRAAQMVYQQVFSPMESSLAFPMAHRPEAHHAARHIISGVAPAAPLPTVADAWSPLQRLRTPDGWFGVPIHASLVPDGRVVLFGLEFSTAGPSPLRTGRTAGFTLLPSSGTGTSDVIVTDLREPRDYDRTIAGDWIIGDTVVCGGQTLMSDGRLFTAGGTQLRYNVATKEQQFFGIPYPTMLDGTSWRRVPTNMRGTAQLGQPWRWYPTTTRLPDSRILVAGGFDEVQPRLLPNASAEIFDPRSTAFQLVAPTGSAPMDIVSSLYTHTFVLPSPRDGRAVLMFGEPGVPVFMTLSDTAQWSVSSRARTGSEAFQQDRREHGGTWNPDLAPNFGAASTLLPIRVRDSEWGYANGSVLVAGGHLGTTHMQYVDIYDPVADAWLPRLDAQLPRSHPSTVLLPDGRILIIAGAAVDAEIRRAQYVDPRAGMVITNGASEAGEVRGYHSVALLLPDGRILVGGGLPGVAASEEQPTFRYYSPSYMFAERPRITAAPTGLTYGREFTVEIASPKPPGEVVLMGLGAMTHSFDMNQRSVQLEVTQVQPSGSDRYRLTVRGPRDAPTASPGHYMLFVLDVQRIPSEARIVHLDTTQPPLTPTAVVVTPIAGHAPTFPNATPSRPGAATAIRRATGS